MKVFVACDGEIYNRAYDFTDFLNVLPVSRHHVHISGRDVTELYTAINSPRGPGQCPKSAQPYILQFRRYRGKSGLGVILPPTCRDKG